MDYSKSPISLIIKTIHEEGLVLIRDQQQIKLVGWSHIQPPSAGPLTEVQYAEIAAGVELKLPEFQNLEFVNFGRLFESFEYMSVIASTNDKKTMSMVYEIVNAVGAHVRTVNPHLSGMAGDSIDECDEDDESDEDDGDDSWHTELAHRDPDYVTGHLISRSTKLPAPKGQKVVLIYGVLNVGVGSVTPFGANNVHYIQGYPDEISLNHIGNLPGISFDALSMQDTVKQIFGNPENIQPAEQKPYAHFFIENDNQPYPGSGFAHVLPLPPENYSKVVELYEKPQVPEDAARVVFERDTLAAAIAEAALKAGIYNGEVSLSGPMLLLMLQNMADLLAESNKEK